MIFITFPVYVYTTAVVFSLKWTGDIDSQTHIINSFTTAQSFAY